MTTTGRVAEEQVDDLLPAGPATGRRSPRRARPADVRPRAAAWSRTTVIACAAAVVALTGLVVALAALVVPPPVEGLPQAGVVTDVGLVMTQVADRVLAPAAVGALLLAAVLVPPAGRGGHARDPDLVRRATSVGAAAAAAWAVTTVVGAAFEVARLTATPVHVLPGKVLLSFLVDVPPGRASAAAAGLAALCAVAALTLPGRRAAVVALGPALAALVVPQVLSGHAATSTDHALAVVLLSTHVVVATAWVGGLAAIVLLARGDAVLPGVATRFSTVALVCFVATGATGAAAAWVVLEGAVPVPDTFRTPYGLLLAAKSTAFVLVGAAGWWHRRRTLPALRRGAPRAFARFAAAETAVLLVATGLAVTLASAEPPPPAAQPAVSPPASQAGPDPASAPATAPDPGSEPVEDMSGHDHGELSVSVLVDAERYHVAGTVTAGQLVTVFNSAPHAVTLTARDGAFDVEVASRSLTTFVAPSEPGSYDFSSRGPGTYADVLVVGSR